MTEPLATISCFFLYGFLIYLRFKKKHYLSCADLRWDFVPFSGGSGPRRDCKECSWHLWTTAQLAREGSFLSGTVTVWWKVDVFFSPQNKKRRNSKDMTTLTVTMNQLMMWLWCFHVYGKQITCMQLYNIKISRWNQAFGNTYNCSQKRCFFSQESSRHCFWRKTKTHLGTRGFKKSSTPTCNYSTDHKMKYYVSYTRVSMEVSN